MGLDQEGKPFSWGNAKGRMQTEPSRDGLPCLGVRTNRSLLGSTDFIVLLLLQSVAQQVARRAGDRWETEQPQCLAQTFQQNEHVSF